MYVLYELMNQDTYVGPNIEELKIYLQESEHLAWLPFDTLENNTLFIFSN